MESSVAFFNTTDASNEIAFHWAFSEVIFQVFKVTRGESPFLNQATNLSQKIRKLNYDPLHEV